MATKSWDPKQPQLLSAPGRGGISAVNPNWTEAASQDFKAGCPVILSSGTVTELADASSGAFTAAATALGIAMADASGTTGAAIPVLMFEPGQVWRFHITNDGTDALASTLTKGTNYGLYVDANQVVSADANITGSDMVTYLGPIGGDSAQYYGRFRILASVCVTNVGA